MTVNGYIYLALAIVICLLAGAVAIEYGIISGLQKDKAALALEVKNLNEISSGLKRDADNCKGELRTFQSELIKSREECEADKWKWIDKDRKDWASQYAAELARCRAAWDACEKQITAGGDDDCKSFILRSITPFYYPDSVHPYVHLCGSTSSL